MTMKHSPAKVELPAVTRSHRAGGTYEPESLSPEILNPNCQGTLIRKARPWTPEPKPPHPNSTNQPFLIKYLNFPKPPTS